MSNLLGLGWGSRVLSRLRDVQLEQVRSYRKPRWLPMAKSKRFHIPTKPAIIKEDYEELKRLHANYKTQVRAVEGHIRRQYIQKKSGLSDARSIRSLEEATKELDACFVRNEEWNKKVAAERELYDVERRKQQLEMISKTIEIEDQKRKEQMEDIARTIKEHKRLSEVYIPRERIEEAIEESLKTVVDYNFAIDLQGNIIKDTPVQDDTKL